MQNIFSDLQTRLFQKFQHEGIQPGTGLGLVIAQLIVQLMGGTIAVTSPWKPDGSNGTCLHFNCVCNVTSAKAIASLQVRSTGKAAALPQIISQIPRDLHILIADDMPMNRKIMERKLAMEPFADLGYFVTHASSAEEVVRLMKANHSQYDLLLIDENFNPASGGHLLGSEATKIIRAWEEEVGAPRIPIISCTGNCTQNDAERYIQAGVDHCWGKPLPTQADMASDLARLVTQHSKTKKAKHRQE